MLLQALAGAALVVSMLHPVMVQTFAFIMQLIDRANLLRITAFGPRRNLDNVTDFFIF